MNIEAGLAFEGGGPTEGLPGPSATHPTSDSDAAETHARRGDRNRFVDAGTSSW
jgi:hypothetical protein